MSTEIKKGRTRIKKKQSKALPIESSFWKNKTFDELAKEQGVKPFRFEDCGKNWPKDADFDRFFAAIKRIRNGEDT
jgi:hypothetical protein